MQNNNMKKTTMFLAEMDTRHDGEFRALALTRREALDAIRKGVAKRAKHLLEYTGEGDESGDINVLEMTPLAAYQDYSKV